MVANRFTLSPSATDGSEASPGLSADGQPIDDTKLPGGGNAAVVAALGAPGAAGESTKGGVSSAAHTPSSPSRSSAFAREVTRPDI